MKVGDRVKVVSEDVFRGDVGELKEISSAPEGSPNPKLTHAVRLDDDPVTWNGDVVWFEREELEVIPSETDLGTETKAN